MIILQDFGIILLIVSSFVTILLGFLAFRSDPQNATTKIFLLLCLVIPVWLSVFTVSTRPDIAGVGLLLFTRLSLVFAVLVNILFLLIAQTFPSRVSKVSSRTVIFWSVLAAFMVIIVLSPITFRSIVYFEGALIPDVGPGMTIFALFNLASYLLTFVVLRKRLRATTIEEEHRALFSLSMGMFLMISFMFFTISLPVALYNVTTFVPLAPLYTLFFVVFLTYGVLKHRLFNAKVLATQIFVFILGVVFFARLFTTPFESLLPDTAIFLATVVFGFLLVRSVKQEIRTREEMRELAKRLAETNWQLAKTNERLHIIDQRKSEFVSIVSHQLRSPLTAIKGYASMLIEESYGAVPKGLKAPIEKIFISSERLTKMISDFLDISKIELGTMTYDFASVDVNAMLVDLVGEFTPLADAKHLTLDFDCPANEKFLVTADEGKIRQILSNLIDNSIKYTKDGGVFISLRKDDVRGMIVIELKDTGIGLSQDDIHHLFGKFTRGSQGRRQNAEGSGLGLYVAKKMLEAHRGKIWIDSAGPEKGSTFTVELLAEDHD